ncbi:hypothetical protein FJZ22_02295 [Candidatus Pacearchaeota archaeon]|nr:hypothetical protein [Candidatus Pacearchaeota archaeon]
MKVCIFDSGVIINLAMNNLLYLFPILKKKTKLVITPSVKREIIDRPLTIPRFALEALQVKELFDEGIIELPEGIGIQSATLEAETKKLMDKANHFVQTNGAWVPIVSEGEISCLALSKALTEKKIENIIAIDERTTRLLIEAPRNLERLMSDKLHKRITLAYQDLSVFSIFTCIRSSELVYVAYKQGILHPKNKQTLSAALYATKYKGASITFEEIEQLKKLG